MVWKEVSFFALFLNFGEGGGIVKDVGVVCEGGEANGNCQGGDNNGLMRVSIKNFSLHCSLDCRLCLSASCFRAAVYVRNAPSRVRFFHHLSTYSSQHLPPPFINTANFHRH